MARRRREVPEGVEPSQFTGDPVVPRGNPLDIADAADLLTSGLVKALLWRLQAGTCEHCGYDGLDTPDLKLVHEFLKDNEHLRLRQVARESVKANSRPAPITIDLPFQGIPESARLHE